MNINKKFYIIEKSAKKSLGYIDKTKIHMAKNKKTPINILDELLLEDIIDIRIEVYNRRDFEDIKPFLKNLNLKEFEIYKTILVKVISYERIEFITFKIYSIGIIILLSILLCLFIEIAKFLIMSNVFIN